MNGNDPISTSLDANDSTFTFKFVTRYSDNNVTAFETAGIFFVYVVADDSKNVDVKRSQSKFQVKHSPTIGLDRPVSGLTKINSKSQQLLTINWSRTGDEDIDQDAKIALYADTSGSNHTAWPTLIANTARINITNGFTEVTENSATDQFVWDLRTASTVPTEAQDNEIYALITDNVDTVLSKAPGEVQFTHDPDFRFNVNLGVGAGKGTGAAQAQIVIDQVQVFRLNFDAFDLDNAQQFIRLYATQLDTASNDLSDLDAVEGTFAWLINSTTGLRSQCSEFDNL